MIFTSGIMKSALPKMDFEMLLRRHNNVDAGGFITGSDQNTVQSRRQLEAGYYDFKTCLEFLGLHTGKGGTSRNKRWGTTLDMLSKVEAWSGRKIMHGALLLAAELVGHHLEQENENENYAWIRLSKDSTRLL